MAKWQNEITYDKAIKFVLFLLWPLGSFLFSLRSMNRKSSYVVFFLFALLFGLSFTVQSGKSAEVEYDSASYRMKFEEYFGDSYYRYIDGLEGFLTFEDGKKDYYFDTVAFYLSRVTHNYHVLFLVFAVVFAFFALKSFRFLTSEDAFTTSLSCFILAYLFMINQIFNINGVRFWTAAWIGVYCIFQLFRNGNKKYLWLALLTPFVHGAFWVYLAVIALAYLFRKYEKAWVFLFFVSFFASNIAIGLIRNITELLPPFLAELAASYTDQQYVEKLRSAGSGFYWVAEMFSLFVRVYMNLLVYLFIKNAAMIKANPKSKQLYKFLLVWMTFVNFTMFVPSLGGRFFVIAYPLIAYIWLVNFKGVKYQRVLYAMPFIFVFTFYRQFGLYMGVLQTEFFISNPFYLIYKNLMV